MSVVHMADPEGDVVVAECGATGFILPDASLTPEDFDFAFPNSPCVNCLPCLKKFQCKGRQTLRQTVRA